MVPSQAILIDSADTLYQVLGIKYLTPSTWYKVSKYLVQSTWYQELSTKFRPSTKYQVLGTEYLVPTTWY